MTPVRAQDAALFAGCSPDTLRQWVKRGHIRTLGTGRRQRYDLASLADWLERRNGK